MIIASLKTFFSHPASLTIGMGFASLSLMLGAWLTRLPEIQLRLGLNDAQWGMALFVMSLGSLSITPISSYIIERYTVGASTLWSVILQCITFLLPLFAYDYLSLLLSMFILGGANGFINVTLNASAAGVERESQVSILSSCHGMFSVGAMIGAASASLIAGFGISPESHLGIMAIGLVLLNLNLRPIWLKIPSVITKTPLLAIPPRPILGLVAMSFAIVLAEVAIMDWSAIYLKNTLQGSPFIAGLGLAGFSLSMAVGRFYGDSIIPNFGRQRIVFIGALIGAGGIIFAALIPQPVFAVVGFTIAGLGFSCVVPILFSSGARIPKVESGVAIASIATAAIMGSMVGRRVVGLIAEEVDLHAGLLFAAALALLGAILAKVNKW